MQGWDANERKQYQSRRRGKNQKAVCFRRAVRSSAVFSYSLRFVIQKSLGNLDASETPSIGIFDFLQVYKIAMKIIATYARYISAIGLFDVKKWPPNVLNGVKRPFVISSCPLGLCIALSGFTLVLFVVLLKAF